jgi:hypothetical protein
LEVTTDVRLPLDCQWATPHQETAEEETAEDRAQQRRAVLCPILEQKDWTIGKLVTESGVGKATVYGFFDGTRKQIHRANRKAIADALGIPLTKLPK